MSEAWEVLVIGGGHAGIEAAHAAAKMGRRTVLVTPVLDAVGRMSCNPAIGGLAKGQLVREVDALGGAMGLLADRAGIQFKMLNRSRGPAVWGPRAQCDKVLYAAEALALLRRTPGLTLIESAVEDLQESSGRVTGVVTAAGDRIAAATVVMTTGTFLRGLMHTGGRRTPGGRAGESAASGLSAALSRLDLRLGRFKTGTPPRLDRDTIDYAACLPQEGDAPPVPFSFRTAASDLPRRQALCWKTATNPAAHALIRDNLHRSPMYSGAIRGIGPRYCPSVEDKVVRFAEKPSHTLFLEPEGWDAEEIYVNGLSTSLPEEVQRGILAAIPALSRARLLRPGYAVEYDFVFPDQLRATLETLAVEGLFLAGQINGTSGYEEAAAQGILAGVNAALRARGEAPFVLGRSEAYAAVLVDDLTTKGLDEPYRLFTSRAEHRLLLGVDSVLARLAPHGHRLGLVSREEHDGALAGEERLARADRRLADFAIVPDLSTRATLAGALGIDVDMPTTARNLLKRHDLNAESLAGVYPDLFAELSLDECGILASRVRYEGYVNRERERLRRLEGLDRRSIPDSFRYEGLPGLTGEVVERCSRKRPRTLGEASRIPGVTPAAVAIISAHVARGGRGAG